METISLTSESYLLFEPCYYLDHSDSILIVPSSAGYFSQDKISGEYKVHIDEFCKRLASRFRVYYLVMPGQDQNIPNSFYSYESSVASTLKAIQYIVEHRNLIGVIGMCTGGAIASEAMQRSGKYFPLVLYNSAVWVGWSTPAVQDKFEKRYQNVRLDKESLLTAPMPGDVIAKHEDAMMQILCGNSIPYPLVGTPDCPGQREMKKKNLKFIEQVLFNEMSDVPVSTLPEYSMMLQFIFRFFGANV